MKCEQIRERFLEQPVAPEVKAHVAACAECARVWQGFEGTLRVLDEWQAPEVSPFFDTRFQARLAEVKQQEAARSAGVLGWFRVSVWRPAMVGALAIAVTIGVAVMNQAVPPPQAEQGSAVVDLQSMEKQQDLISSDLLDDLNAPAPNNANSGVQDQI